MALEAIELVCGCCELCLSVAELGNSRKEAREERSEKSAQTARVVRMAREEKRGVRLSFAKNRIIDVEFLSGPAAGKRASAMPDMELKRLALAMPHRTARFAIRRYLRHRKKGRVSAPHEPAIRR
jgi:hypothetical protein